MRRTDALGVGLANRRALASWASPSSVANPARVSSSSNGRPGAIACGRSCERSNRRCGGACISQYPYRENGCSWSSAATSITTRRQLTDDAAIMDFLLSSHVGKFDMYVEDECAAYVRYCFQDPMDAAIFRSRFEPKSKPFRLAG